MAFLNDLRMANIFPRNAAKDRPFGMPEIDNGNIGSLLRQILPIADSMNRGNGLNTIASSMRASPSPRNMGGTVGHGIEQTPGARRSVFDPNANVRLGVDSGITPMQRGFLAQDAQERSSDRADENANINFMRSQDLTKDKYRHEEDIADKEVAARTSLFDRELAGKKALSEVDYGHKTSLFDQEAKLRQDIADANNAARSKDVVTRETLRNEGKTTTPKQTADAYKFAAQKLKTENSVLGSLIDIDDTGAVNISPKANPEQRKRITAILNNEQYQAPVTMGEEQAMPGKTLRQRNPATGAIRESADGGKTWKIISNGSK